MTSRRTLGPLHVTRDRGEPARLLSAIWADDLAWVTDQALCAQTDPALFFVEPGHDHLASIAKAVCRECALIDACLTYALSRPDFGGVWGGTGPEERKALRKKRRAA